MAYLGFLLVCTFGNYLAPILIAAHTANNLDLGDEPEDKKKETEKLWREEDKAINKDVFYVECF